MIFYGDTPSQASEKSYNAGLQNRRDITRQNELEADYAFRTNQMENAAAQNMAALARAQQQDTNQLAREAFMFREQQKQIAKQDAMARLQFDAKRKDIDREFAFAEKKYKADEMEDSNEAENTGITLAETLTRLNPVAAEARRVRDAAAAAEAAIVNNARRIGYGYDEAKKKIVGNGAYRTAEDYNRELGEARMNLKAAKEALMPIEIELAIAERQARQFKFAISPEAITDITRRKSYKIGVPAATPPPTTAPAPRVMPEIPAPLDDRGMPSAAARYIPGRVYGVKRYLGGPPTDRTSWQTVTN